MSQKVEILLATYNGENYIREQIDSILNQDYTNWLIRACDDASTDRTYEILREYQEKYPEQFIIEKNDKGYGSAKLNFMNLMKKSTCDYVMCCDQDDVWLPNKISLTLQEMKKQEKGNVPVLIHTDLKVVDSELRILSESFFEHSNFRKEFRSNEILIQNFVTGCTMMLNRPLIELMNMEEHYEKILMHDWLAAVLAVCKGKVGFVDCPTMLYRQHAVNSVGAKEYGIALFIEKIKNAKMKQSLIDTTKQAGQIAETYKGMLGEEQYRLVYQYSKIWEKNKIHRVCFYLKHRVLKKGFPRKVCQLIIG